MENLENSKYVKTNDYVCMFCNSTFSLKKTLDVHVKTNKKCISNRPKVDISCIWCKGKFLTNDMLDKHYKKCDVDKNMIYIKSIEQSKNKDILLLEKDKEIERLNNIIKDITGKIKGDVNVTNNNNTVTYNITLNCAKPLLLSKERIIKLMDRTCEPSYIKRGQEGLADWFLNDVCRNDNNDIAIECTDKNRKRFRYEDENDMPKEITGFSLTELLKECIPSFQKTTYYNQVVEEAGEEYKNYSSTNIYESINDFKKVGNKFINYLVDKTHVDSVNCLLTKRKEN